MLIIQKPISLKYTEQQCGLSYKEQHFNAFQSPETLRPGGIRTYDLSAPLVEAMKTTPCGQGHIF
jgi:hypothetical protein